MTPARVLAVLSLLLLVTGCPRKQEAPTAPAQDAGPAQRAEVEPNDRPEQSMAIGESTDVSASLSSTPAKPDEDWYLLFSDRPRTVDATVSGIPGTVVLLEAYDETRTRLAAVSAEAEGQPARFPNLTVRGKLLLRVSAARKGAILALAAGHPAPAFDPADQRGGAAQRVRGPLPAAGRYPAGGQDLPAGDQHYLGRGVADIDPGDHRHRTGPRRNGPLNLHVSVTR